jgi:voltage-gated potassium channel Kch
MWGEGYGLIELLRPGSLKLPSVDPVAGPRAMLQYFSFVTITTVGYGDIYPVSPLARATAATEALLGQLYLVVLVARLVGLHTAQEARERH